MPRKHQQIRTKRPLQNNNSTNTKNPGECFSDDRDSSKLTGAEGRELESEYRALRGVYVGIM